MALANNDHHHDPTTMSIIQAGASFYEHKFGTPSLLHHHHHSSTNSSPEEIIYSGISKNSVYREPESPEKGPVKNFTVMSNSSSVSSPSSTNSNGILGYNNSIQAPAANNNYSTTLSEEGHSVISFKPDYGDFGGSLLSFDRTERLPVMDLYQKMVAEEDEYTLSWEDHDLQHHQNNNSYLNHPKSSTNTGLPETSSSHRAAAAGGQLSWLSDQEANNKRPSTGENLQALKKQCVGSPSNSPSKKAKLKSPSPSPSKDPQSLAAKNRRERISERLKILQDLVPNGSKVDLVTMLEKAISYVKFLQLQVKVLATDEFWPAQGGKAPDLSQVREAIDAILASQRDRNSNSK